MGRAEPCPNASLYPSNSKSPRAQRKVNRSTLERASRLGHAIFRAAARRILSLLKLLPTEQRADLVDLLLGKPATVDTPNGQIRFLNHSGVNYWRARTIMTKEPDSMRWIDAIPPGSVFWDIGANVGVLTLYAAMRGDLDVWAFEPAAVNFYNLVANCELNGLEKRVRCLQLGFSDTLEIANLHVSQLMSGHSFTFKESAKIKPRKKIYPSLQPVQLCTIDDFIARYDAPCPNYIKIDVPGLTHEIFAGAKHTLSQPDLKEIQVEAREHGGSGKRLFKVLAPLGFKIKSRGMRRKGEVQRDLVFARDSGIAMPRSSATVVNLVE
jgi:FkbM family methyltransferase